MPSRRQTRERPAVVPRFRMALDDLPGTISQRVMVEDSGSGEEDDFGTFAHLKTGNEKKAALKEKERRKNLQSMEVGGKAEAVEAPSSSAETAPPPTASPKPPPAGAKRPRRGRGAAKAPTPDKVVHDLDGEEELDESDRKLAKSNKEHNERLRRMRDTLQALDEDEDEDEALPAARAGPSASAFAPRHLWLTVVAGRGGRHILLRCQTDQPLEAKLVHRIASELGYLPEHMALWVGPAQQERQLDVRRSATELGLVDKQEVRVEEVEPPKGLRLLLSREGEREHAAILHPPDGSFASLLAAYCALKGLQTAAYRLQFDGDTLSPSGTPAGTELEDDDLGAPAAPPRRAPHHAASHHAAPHRAAPHRTAPHRAAPQHRAAPAHLYPRQSRW